MKKFISSVLATTLCASLAVVPAFSEGAGEIPPSEEIAYEVTDLMTGEKVYTLESQIEDEQWDTEMLGDISPEAYKDFPMEISNNTDYFARLNMSFTYLKEIGSGDTVTFQMAERSSGEVIYSSDISMDARFISIENIPLNKVYNLTLTENFADNNTIYRAVIETKFGDAGFPSNVSLHSDIFIPDDDLVAETVIISPVHEDMEKIITDEEGNVTIIADERTRTEISADELPSYYNTLEPGNLYNVQSYAFVDGNYTEYNGFISTAVDGRNLGIFMPAYKFYTEDAYNNRPLFQPFISVNDVTAGYISSNYWAVNYYEDYQVSFPMGNGDRFVILRIRFPEAGSYTLGTLGSGGTNAQYWTENNGVITKASTYFGYGSNFTINTTVAANQTRYVVVYLDNQATGNTVFRIKSNGYSGDVINSILESESLNQPKPTNAPLPTEYIDYEGDVDIYHFKNTVTGQYGFTLKNNGSQDLSMKLIERINSASSLWEYPIRTVKAGASLTWCQKLSSANSNCFVRIASNAWQYYYQPYVLEIDNPEKPDPYEANNSFAVATSLSGKASPIDITLHKSDVDYCTFTTGSNGADFFARLTAANDIVYNISLYKENPNGTTTLITTGEKDPGWSALLDPPGAYNSSGQYKNLEGSTKYYICIDYNGLGTDSYHPVIPARLSWSLYQL